ncbi:MAG: hypothetical protein LBK59_09465, partial [Bifidobacteriaceae bacterium]|nr:hypothetical protein [Bifidobacteriaceae bacterium]
DRVRAVRLAEGLRTLGFDAPEPETNILMVRCTDPVTLAARWNAAGVGCFPMGGAVRLVTHRDIDDDAITQAVELVAGTAAT